MQTLLWYVTIPHEFRLSTSTSGGVKLVYLARARKTFRKSLDKKTQLAGSETVEVSVLAGCRVQLEGEASCAVQLP